MAEALAEAANAFQLGEVPVGAVVVVENRIIARAHNEVELRHDATAHAEILAVQRASQCLGSWRLAEASLFVTLEPCAMCVGALLLARVKRLYFGAYDARQGAVGSLFDLSRDPALSHAIEVYPEVLADEARDLLARFFEGKRD